MVSSAAKEIEISATIRHKLQCAVILNGKLFWHVRWNDLDDSAALTAKTDSCKIDIGAAFVDAQRLFGVQVKAIALDVLFIQYIGYAQPCHIDTRILVDGIVTKSLTYNARATDPGITAEQMFVIRR